MDKGEPGPDSGSLWRSDEGQSVVERPDSPPPRLWRNDEVGQPSSRPATTPNDIWGEKEIPQEAASALKVEAPPDVWDSKTGTSLRNVPIEITHSGLNGGSEGPRDPRRLPPDPKPSRRRRIILTFLIVVIIGLMVDASLVAAGLSENLRDARSALEEGLDLLADASFDEAQRSFESARAEANEARSLIRRPSALAASVLPVTSIEMKGVDALADAAYFAAEAGLEGLAGVRAIRSPGLDAGASIYRDGGVDLALIASARPHLESAAARIAAASTALAVSSEPKLSDVADALVEARSALEDASHSLERGREALNLLPDLLGSDRERRYFLAFQALGEARGTGGLVGSYGIVRASGGKTELEHVGPIDELIPSPAVEAPTQWFEESYSSQSSLSQIQQANLTPNFPIAAEVILRMYGSKTGDSLDGVIALDPVALAHMLEGTGPIRAAGLDAQVSAENAAEILLVDSYTRLPNSDAQDAYIADLVAEFWERLDDPSTDEIAFVRGLGEALSTEHVKIYSRDADLQDSLTSLGVAGDFTTFGPNVQLVFVNNYGPNKLDYFLDRKIDTQIQIGSDLRPVVTTTIELTNGAEKNMALRGLLGPNEEPTNTMQLGVLLPKGASGILWSVDGEQGIGYTYEDAGHEVIWDVLSIPAGESALVELIYEMPSQPSTTRFSFTNLEQTAASPSRGRVVVSSQ